jgi:GntR family transcriptional regulator
VVSEALGTAPDLARASSRPAYVRIEQWLTSCIVDGTLVPGDKLPREEQLAASLGVSRMTLRQALSGLEAVGTIVRRPGRQGGTFVAQPRIVCDLTGLAGFTEQMRRAHVRAGARVVSAVTRPASRTEAHALGLRKTGTVHEVVRVRSADREPLAIEQACFPAALFPDLLEQRLTGSLYRLLGKRYDHAPHTAHEVLEPVISSPEQARLLRIDAGSPLMLIERTAFTASGVAVEHAHDLFRSDRTRITLRTGLSDDARAEVAGTIRVP